jgi:hypothetical protein
VGERKSEVADLNAVYSIFGKKLLFSPNLPKQNQTPQSTQKPQTMYIYKLLKKPFFGNFMVKWRTPLPEAEQKEWQTIQTPSKSGGTIFGLFAPAHSQPAKATIVLGHPMGKEAKAYFIKMATLNC